MKILVELFLEKYFLYFLSTSYIDVNMLEGKTMLRVLFPFN